LKSKTIFLSLLLLLQAALFARAQQIPEAPNPPRLVNDFAGVLSADEVQALEQKLISYEDSTSNQVAIVLIKSLDGADVADYAVKLALKWGIGSKKDNGVLLLAAIDDRKVRVEVGYGLEGRITDMAAKQIRESLKPYFRENQYYQGLAVATDEIAKAAAGEYQGQYQYTKNKKKKGDSPWGFLSIILVLLLIFLFSRGGRGGGGGFLTGMLLGQLLGGGGRRGGGSWGDFSSGGGSFGGFGGGGFGGGGSSGDW